VTTASKQCAVRPFKIQPLCEFFCQNYGKVTAHRKGDDESMILWWGSSEIRVFNPRKVMKYGVLIRVMCEALKRYQFIFVMWKNTQL